MSLWYLLLLAPAGFGLGWVVGYVKGRETYATEVGEQSERIKMLWHQVEALEEALIGLGGIVPSRADSVRVLDLVSKGADLK